MQTIPGGSPLEKGDLSPERVRASIAQMATQTGLTYDPNQTITGTTFSYDDSFANLYGDVGYGPLGPNWDQAGLQTTNVYVPGYFGSQKPVLGHPPVMSADFFKRTYLRGMDQILAEYGDIEEQFNYFLDTAVAALESAIGLFLYPRVIVTDATSRGFRAGIDFDIEVREQDFNANDFFNWGWMTLQYGPVMSIQQIQMVYPTGAEILKFPNSWIKPQMLSRQIRLVPPQGALSY